MNWHVLFTCVLIAGARITDISLDTVRTVAIIQGRRVFAAILGFCEAFIYIFAIASVLQHFDHRIYAIAYAGGFAAGTYLGMMVEQRLAFGSQLVTIFTRKSPEMTPVLRGEGFRVTEFTGRGRDGEVAALFIQIPRSQAGTLAHRARALDPACFYVINDVRTASSSSATVHIGSQGSTAA